MNLVSEKIFCISKLIAVVFLVLLLSASNRRDLSAQTRQFISGEQGSGYSQVTICSQNLKNYQAKISSKSGNKSGAAGNRTPQETALMKRFIETGCDIIAIQEVIGNDEPKALANLEHLARLLKSAGGRSFVSKVGEVNDASQRVGFLIADDKAEIQNTITYRKLLLPKLDEAQKPRLFVRAPLEIQLLLKGSEETGEKQLSLINFHFKSKSKSQNDPALLQWETYRMEMAEGLRRIVLSRYQRTMGAGQAVVLIGDRNSHFDSASAKILEGSLVLDDFKGQGVCRLNKRGAPLCKAEVQKPKEFISVITEDPETKKLAGTYQYKKVFSFIDDILINPQSAAFFREKTSVEGNYDSGIVHSYPEASDHGMVYTRIKW